MDEKMTHDDLVILTEWMARHHFTAGEVAYAVAKPWKHVDLLELARDDRDPEDAWARAVGRHFHMPAREMLLNSRQVCPVHPCWVLRGWPVSAGERWGARLRVPGRSRLGGRTVCKSRQRTGLAR